MSLLAFFIAAIVLAITPGPGIAYVLARTAAGARSKGLAASSTARAARARLMTRVPGVTMVGLGAWLAFARRDPSV